MEIYYLSSDKEKLMLDSDRLWVEDISPLLSVNMAYELSTNNSEYATIDKSYEDVKEVKLRLKVVADDSEDFQSIMDSLERTIIADGIMGKRGRIYVNGCYKEVMLVKREVTDYPYFANCIDFDGTFLTMRQAWITEEKFSYRAIEGATGLKLPFKLPKQLPVVKAVNSINLDHYKGSDFLMVAYGPFSEFTVTVGGNLYSVNQACLSGEQLVIDSRASAETGKQCYVVHANGTTTNVLKNRGNANLFAKIPGNATTLEYSQAYGLDLTVFISRGDPTWNY